MKLKVSLIIGFLLLAIGIGTVIFAVTRDDFEIKEIIDSNIEYIDVELEATDVDTLVLNVKSDNVKIRKSENEKINIKSKKSDNMHYEEKIEGNKLIITQSFEHKYNFTLGIFQPYEIYLPFEILEEASINMTAGNLDINDININKGYIDLDAGNLDINNSALTNCEVLAKAGNVKLITGDINTLKAEVKTGNLKIEANNISNATLDVNAGNLNANADTIDRITANVDAGNLKIEAKITIKADFNVSAGNLTLKLIGSSDDYAINSAEVNKATINLDVDFGDKNIDYID